MRSFTRLTLLLTLLAISSAAAALELYSGEQRNTLVELYTSQGCSSCPPAERWLGQLQNDPQLWRRTIPVAFHVDYWDYLGWKDEFADAAYSARQRRHQKEGNLSAVYTPAFVVNGKEWRRWFGLRELPHNDQPSGTLRLNIDNERLTAVYRPRRHNDDGYTLNIAILGIGIKADIAHGENAGKTLPQDFVVLAFQASSNADGNWQLELPKQESDKGVKTAIAAWVTPRDSLHPLQVVGGWLTGNE